MAKPKALEWARANRWALALIAVLFLSYIAGKDLALRDNARDARHGVEQAR